MSSHEEGKAQQNEFRGILLERCICEMQEEPE
jgi:hypothetical protein